MSQRSAWARRLSDFADFSIDDDAVLADLTREHRQEEMTPAFLHSRDAPGKVVVVLSGMGYRARTLADGRRQVLAYMLPGDMSSIDHMILGDLDQVCFFTRSRVALMNRADVQLLRERPKIHEAIACYSLQKEAILLEWLINIGSRSAQERVAHLICELNMRLSQVGLASDGVFRLGITQSQLGETLCLSAVHVNRVLMSLRRQNAVTIANGIVTIHDVRALSDLGGFDPSYLQSRRACLTTARSPAAEPLPDAARHARTDRQGMLGRPPRFHGNRQH